MLSRHSLPFLSHVNNVNCDKLLHNNMFYIPIDFPRCNAGEECIDEAECQNSSFGQVCSCKSGFTLKKRKCNERDGCAQSVQGCTSSNACKNLNEFYSCSCESKHCQKADECDSKNSPCHQNARCFKESGLVKCKCEEGFSGDGFTCSPVENSEEVIAVTKDNNSKFHKLLAASLRVKPSLE